MSAKMTLGDMAKALNRPAIVLTHLQKQFELPVLEGAAYPPAYFALLRKIVHLVNLSIPEKEILDLWKTEKHLLQLLHVDATGSPTWFLDECGKNERPEQRLLLTHHDLGPGFPHEDLQPSLDFTPKSHGLFSHKETGDDIRHVLDRYLALYADIQAQAAAEAEQLRHTLRWFPHLRPL